MEEKKRDEKGRFTAIHNDKQTKLYGVWCSMKSRCNNPHNKSYKNYGARNITVCKDWSENYLSFKKWAIANGYREGLTIDRIDVDGKYEPLNCRWVTTKVQNRNYRRNIFVEYKGQFICLKEVSEKENMEYGKLLSRYKLGKRGEDLLFKGDKRYGRKYQNNN